MPEPQTTKLVLAGALKELMESRPLSKISVGDIANACSLNRQTFYYHFKDKYDLVNWIYKTETVEFMHLFTDPDRWVDGMYQICAYMQENKKFYINALSIQGQNSFSDYLLDLVHQLIAALIEESVGENSMSSDELDFVADFYAYAMTGLISKWARHGMREEPREYVKRICRIMSTSFPFPPAGGTE